MNGTYVLFGILLLLLGGVTTDTMIHRSATFRQRRRLQAGGRHIQATIVNLRATRNPNKRARAKQRFLHVVVAAWEEPATAQIYYFYGYRASSSPLTPYEMGNPIEVVVNPANYQDYLMPIAVNAGGA